MNKYFYLKLRDGFGAAFQQILGAIGLSEHFNLSYVYDESDVQIGHHIKNLNEFLNLKNSRFEKPTNLIRAEGIQKFDPAIFKEDRLTQVDKLHNFLERNNLVFLYEKAAEIIYPHLKKYESIYDSNYTNVALHVRRGDITANKSYIESRFIDLEFYKKIINSLKNNPKEKPYKFHFFTQYNKISPDEFKEFYNLHDVLVHIDFDESPTAAFSHWWNLTYADILIQSKSSYSYSAGFFNKNIVYYIPFWHKPSDNWKNINQIIKND